MTFDGRDWSCLSLEQLILPKEEYKGWEIHEKLRVCSTRKGWVTSERKREQTHSQEWQKELRRIYHRSESHWVEWKQTRKQEPARTRGAEQDFFANLLLSAESPQFLKWACCLSSSYGRLLLDFESLFGLFRGRMLSFHWKLGEREICSQCVFRLSVVLVDHCHCSAVSWLNIRGKIFYSWLKEMK